MAARSRARVALGASTHTGWAILVTLALAPDGAITILDRRRIEMLGDDRELPRFVYHVAADLPLGEAERFIARALTRATAAATAALRALHADHPFTRTGLILTGRPLPESLASILAAHPLIHTAEGALFRAALRAASESLDVRVTQTHTRELATHATPARLTALGAAVGRPWSKDHRDATLAALAALA